MYGTVRGKSGFILAVVYLVPEAEAQFHSQILMTLAHVEYFGSIIADIVGIVSILPEISTLRFPDLHDPYLHSTIRIIHTYEGSCKGQQEQAKKSNVEYSINLICTRPSTLNIEAVGKASVALWDTGSYA